MGYKDLRPKTGGGRAVPIPLRQGAPPEFGDDAPQLTLFRIKLDDAQTDVRRKAVGNFIWVIAASDLDAEATFKFNKQDNTGIPFQQGTAFGGVRFNELYIGNTAQSGKWLDVLTGVARDPSGLFLLNAASSFTQIALDKANTFAGSGDQSIATATTDTIAADSDRREIVIQADAGNTGAIMIRDDAGNNMAELAAGQSVTVEGTDELQVRNDSGGTLTYRYFEVKE